MHFTVKRKDILPAIQRVIGVVERKQQFPILGNLLINAAEHTLQLTAANHEIELTTRCQPANIIQPERITLPARKLLDVCRTLPEESELTFTLQEQRMVVQANNNRFSLTTLPAEQFPQFSLDKKEDLSIELSASALTNLLAKTAFAMAHQDARYYLNGTFLEFAGNKLTAVATDGHRLALSWVPLEQFNLQHKLILPRKAVMELQRLLIEETGQIQIIVSDNFLQLTGQQFTFTTRLISGNFPPYQRVIPTKADKQLVIDRQLLQDLLARAAVLTNEKHRGVLLQLVSNQLQLQANNGEQDQAEIIENVAYQGEEFAIGFNVSYVQDVLATIEQEQVELAFTTPMNSFLVQGVGIEQPIYVIMPMRL